MATGRDDRLGVSSWDTIARIWDSLLWSRAGAVTHFAELQGHRDP
jgi:hypothetical protein